MEFIILVNCHRIVVSKFSRCAEKKTNSFRLIFALAALKISVLVLSLSKESAIKYSAFGGSKNLQS